MGGEEEDDLDEEELDAEQAQWGKLLQGFASVL